MSRITSILLLIVACHFVQAQQPDSYIYTGKLVDEITGENIKDANIVISGRDFLGRSNFLGYFQAVGSPGQNIYISHVYYELSELDLPFSTTEILVKLKPNHHDIGVFNPLKDAIFEYDQADYDLQAELRDVPITEPSYSEKRPYFPGDNEEFLNYLSDNLDFSVDEAIKLHGETAYFTIHGAGNTVFDSLSFENEILENKISEVINKSPLWLPATQWGSPILVVAKVDFFIDQFLPIAEDNQFVPPDFKDGVMGVYDLINERLEYPLDALYELKEGKAVISYTIDASGTLSGFEINQDPGYGMARELIRVLKTIDGFIAGTINGNPVSTKVVFPFKFELNQQNQKQLNEGELASDDSDITIPINTDFDSSPNTYDSFEEAIERGINAQELIINNKGIKTIPTEINEFKSLENLDLTSNNIRELPEELFSVKSLKRLYLAENLLREVPEGVNELDLLVFNAANNRLGEFPKYVLKCQKLKVLDVSGNQIKSIPGEIKYLKKLKALYLNSLNIKSLPEEIGEMRKLKFIFIKDTSIPEELIDLYINKYPDKQFIF